MVVLWGSEHCNWQTEVEQLMKDGVPKKNHPKAPKKPTKSQAHEKLYPTVVPPSSKESEPSPRGSSQMAIDKDADSSNSDSEVSSND